MENEYNPVYSKDGKNLTGLAIDEWLSKVPDYPYAPCPCGCGKEFKFALKEIEKHEDKFVQDYVQKHSN